MATELQHKDQIKDYILSRSNRIFSNSNKELFKLLLENVFEYTNSINWFITNLGKMKFFLNDEEGFKLIENFLKDDKELVILSSNRCEVIEDKFNEFLKKYKKFQFKIDRNIAHAQDILTWDHIGYRFSPDPKRLTRSCLCK